MKSNINTPARIRRRARMLERRQTLENIILTQPHATDFVNVPPDMLEKKNGSEFIPSKRLRSVAPESKRLRSVAPESKSVSRLPVKNNELTVKESLGFENIIPSRMLIMEKDFSTSQSVQSIDNMQTHISSFHGEESPFPLTSDQKLKILATLLPDILLLDPNSRKPRYYKTAVMFPDVSGFTQLCEKYDKTGKGGPSRLTEVLNGYMGSMIQIVLARNGDVFKFGGDAFLCVWKASESEDVMRIVHLAIESAVDIQKNCGEHKTDVGVKLGVKIAVAAGEALFSVIGTESRKHYVIVGPPVNDVREAEHLCKTGDVIVAPSAWKYVENYMLYSYTYHSDNLHIKVHDFGPLWRTANKSSKDIKGYSSNLRPSLRYISLLKVENLRPFILAPIMRSIDLSQSLGYLTEMRQVAIVFFNVIADFAKMELTAIISLAEKVFRIISGLVEKSDGAVNKLTFFDKDMAVLVVFGLKGFKNEFPSQVALKCAYNCLDNLKKLDVLSASVGVTTGMAYCGVIGHQLRKEYTVMGHPVNMAARLMCAYENIVSADRETFLHSKLDSSHFEILEEKHLKGIQNAGPFYKFYLRPQKTKIKLEIQTYPILGRSKELSEFEKFLKRSLIPDNETNFMIIYGKARIGKSRLVATFVNIAEKRNFDEKGVSSKRRRHKSRRFDISFIALTEDDSKSSHSGTRLLFQQPLGLNENCTVEEREEKIRSKLGEVDPYLLAAFNPIFNVNFDLMPQYTGLNHKEQSEILKTMISSLYTKCFPEGARWLIIIDDAEFLDEESWMVLEWCSNLSHTVLFVLTIGQRRPLSPYALKCLNSFNQKVITLKLLEKWYYPGLACQILGVKAIPIELANLIQTYKSSGNPGWLESFLLSLLQSGRIYIDKISSAKIKELKLILAAPDMLSGSGVAQTLDSSNWLDCLETFEQISDEKENITVCMTGPRFFDEKNEEEELTMDIMFMKTIDTLKPLEQLILKVGSVLGNNFKRSALKFVVNKEIATEEKVFAKGIRNLFDLKILTCAKGDMTQSNILAPRRMILVSALRKEVVCECIGIVIPEECLSLPNYASCGYMQFRSPIFKDTVYNLLLDDQKKKYHNYSIDFLRKNTYKCKSCNNVLFKNVIGYEVNDEFVLACNISPIYGVRSTNIDATRILPLRSLRFSFFNVNARQNFDFSRKLSRAFESELSSISYVDIGDCQCSEILSSVYSVLLEHAAGSGRKDIMLEIQLEYASLSLTTFNIPLTIQILDEALALVNQMKEEKEYPEFCTPFIFSKIYTLMGATKLSMGRPGDSLEFLKMSLKLMNISLPRNKAQMKLLIEKEHIKRILMMYYIPKKRIRRLGESKAAHCDLMSQCLGLISVVHMFMEDWLMAKYASCISLNKALESNRNFYGLCTAYTNVLEVAYHYKDLYTCAKMEIYAIDIFRRCKQKITEVYELDAICRLFRVIFHTRHVRAEIEDAVLIGFQSIKIATVIRNTSLRLDLMPDLVFPLIQLNRLSEAASLLQELEFTSQLVTDKSSRIWYYALCLDFQLDTGFTVIPFDKCLQYLRDEEESFVAIRDINSKNRLYISLWLWSIRNDEWELAKSFTKNFKDMNLSDIKETPINVLTCLKRLEGLLLHLVHRMDTRNIHGIVAAYNDIHSIMTVIEKGIKVVKLLKPRYLLLKAYYRQIRYRDNSCFRILAHAFVLATKMQDENTSLWITHLKMLWSNAISPIQRDYWVEHCRFNIIDWHEADGTKQTAFYSLPLPKY